MKPRDFLNFFKTKSGKLVLFVAIFGGGLLVFSVLRGKSGSDDDMDVRVSGSQTNMTDKPQVVQTVVRPMQPFYPPTPKPEQLPISQTNAAPRVLPEHRPQDTAPAPLPPISLFADSTAGVAEPKSVSSIYAPFGRLISCETVVTVDSASIQTPIVGLVTENVYHAGKLVIPAGTEVHGTAQKDRLRERISSGNSWTLVWQTGEELHLKALALDREFSGDQEGWGITDGSAGLRGRIIKSDNLADIKLFAATFLSGAAEALTEKQQTVFGPITSPSLANAPFEGAQKVLSIYAQRIYEAIQKDGFYVRVPSGKQFYLYVVQTIDRADAGIGGSAKVFAEEDKSAPALPPSFTTTPSTPPFQP
ncbi:MAG: TrbI/VirB10 family protein [Verrucomicrobia bacterium]|nr:TrbI/VirB10 family protein [Verrucomicrobiota bacterium]